MTRSPDIACAACGKTMWRGTGSLPEGQATCRPCRRAARPPARKLEPQLTCVTCGLTYEPRRHNQRYCTPGCRPRGPGAGNTTARGYGAAHQRERAKWKPIVDQGRAECHAVTCLEDQRWIKPGAPWDLGHTEDRSAWTGPEHRHCNRTEGAWRRQHPDSKPPRRWAI